MPTTPAARYEDWMRLSRDPVSNVQADVEADVKETEIGSFKVKFFTND